jgi:hypothetical protein
MLSQNPKNFSLLRYFITLNEVSECFTYRLPGLGVVGITRWDQRLTKTA